MPAVEQHEPNDDAERWKAAAQDLAAAIDEHGRAAHSPSASAEAFALADERLYAAKERILYERWQGADEQGGA